MTFSPNKITLTTALFFCAFSSGVFASDIARTIQTNSQDNTPENFFELGVGAYGYTGSTYTEEDGQVFDAGIVLKGSYNYQGFFIDLLGELSEPLVLGYNAYNSENWAFDIVLGRTMNRNFEDSDTRFEGINQRRASTMLGGRLTRYWGENIMQLSLKHDVSGNSKATTASAIVGRNWQYRNWNFHGYLGLAYDDTNAIDYYFGVSEQEAIDSQFDAYTGEAQVTFFSSAGLTYPISENWIYRANVNLGSDFGQNESPLFVKKRNFNVGFSTSISYVF